MEHFPLEEMPAMGALTAPGLQVLIGLGVKLEAVSHRSRLDGDLLRCIRSRELKETAPDGAPPIWSMWFDAG